jgi:hypothetical protein
MCAKALLERIITHKDKVVRNRAAYSVYIREHVVWNFFPTFDIDNTFRDNAIEIRACVLAPELIPVYPDLEDCVSAVCGYAKTTELRHVFQVQRKNEIEDLAGVIIERCILARLIAPVQYTRSDFDFLLPGTLQEQRKYVCCTVFMFPHGGEQT